MSTNFDWNLKVSALDNSRIVEKVLQEFQSDFDLGTEVTEEFIVNYDKIYSQQRILARENNTNTSLDILTPIIPNSMQVEALVNLETLRTNNKNKALIISATGTGKTYLSAFDAKAFNPKKLLFVVHRLTIAKDSLKTFQRVFG